MLIINRRTTSFTAYGANQNEIVKQKKKRKDKANIEECFRLKIIKTQERTLFNASVRWTWRYCTYHRSFSALSTVDLSISKTPSYAKKSKKCPQVGKNQDGAPRRHQKQSHFGTLQHDARTIKACRQHGPFTKNSLHFYKRRHQVLDHHHQNTSVSFQNCIKTWHVKF